MLIQEEMGVRGVARLFVFIVVLFTIVAANPESKYSEENLLANQISSVGINQELAEELWLNCRLELIHSNEAVEDLEFSGSHGILSNRRSLTKTKEKQVNMEALMGCLVKKNLLFLISGEEKHSPTWYTRCTDFLFSWYGTPRRRELLQVGDAAASAPAPAPATSISETPNSAPPARPPTKPFFPRDYNDSSKSSAPTSDQSSTSQKSTSDGESNKRKSNTKTVLVAVLVTAAVTFIVVALFFICYCKICGVGYRKGKNDERPLLSLSISDYSVASLHGTAGNHSVSGDSHDKMGKNYYMEPNVLNGSKSEIPLGTVTGIAVAAAGNSAQVPPGRMGMHGQPPLKPPPGRVNPFEDPASPAKAANLGPPSGGPRPPAPGPPPGRVNPFEDPASPAPPPPPGPPPGRVNPFEDPVSPAPPPPPPPSSGGPRPPAPGPPPPPPIPIRAKAGPRPPPPPGPGVTPPRPPPTGLKPPRPSPLGSNASASASTEGSGTDGSKTKLKPFFWDKVLANPDHSMVWHQIKSGSFQFDEDMIESLFGYAHADKDKNGQKKDSAFQDASKQYIQIIDQKKAQNLSILLKALNVTTEEVCDALKEGNELPPELLQTLLKMAPTTDEELKLRLYNGDLSRLGPADRFLKFLVDIPFAFKRLESLLFMCSLQEETSTVKESFVTLEAACTELRKSRLFHKLLEAVLKTGNRMNDGTFRGGAQAFKLDTLLKLSDVKGIDGKTTLLHFVVQEIIRSEGIRAARTRDRGSVSSVKSDDLPEDQSQDAEEYYRSTGLQVVSGLSSELENVKKAANLDADGLTSTVSKLVRALKKSQDFLNSEMKNVNDENRFHQTLKSFVQNAEVDIMWLFEEEKRIMALVKSTGDYFHGNAGKDEGLRLFVIVRDFLIILDKVCIEVKNAQKKLNSTPKKENLASKTSESTNTPSADLRQKLFPAIMDRRIDDSSSDDDAP
ncbi:formin-like protein 5 isoform X1 [Lycium ferocissimum]|uniref:formin-like protein 5 isoform X1 n=1 Tax=Lycium ferocissimum TaxID=112874 RepID=UPI002815E6F3|nr:formin-like protein 5 isoform X1 [Lycium ferocissimum]XP_059301103.1 formin-like protein 5 isoform X1 [Lycium ferocissimum]